jgi:Protein of unknown function (DUF3363)
MSVKSNTRRRGTAPIAARFAIALHDEQPAEPVLGRLVARGLDDELTGSAYAIAEGVDGRAHHVRFADIEFTGDAMPGAIVEVRAYEDSRGRKRPSLATRSDLPIEAQVTANGATRLQRQSGHRAVGHPHLHRCGARRHQLADLLRRARSRRPAMESVTSGEAQQPHPSRPRKSCADISDMPNARPRPERSCRWY